MHEPHDIETRTIFMTLNYVFQRLRRFLRRGTSALVPHPVLTALGVLLIVAITLAQLLPSRFLVLNVSPSVPCRLYVLVDAEPAIGNSVEFRPPTDSPGSNYLPPNASILKPIVAGPGDHIDTTGEFLFINGDRVARIFTNDSEGHPLPAWRASRVLESDEFFVLSTRVWNSLDSRYLGPVRRDRITAVRVPITEWFDLRRLATLSHAPTPTRE